MAADDLSRKDLARMLGVSVDQVRKNARRWGLDAAERRFNPRFVRYRRSKALRALTERGLIDATEREA